MKKKNKTKTPQCAISTLQVNKDIKGFLMALYIYSCYLKIEFLPICLKLNSNIKILHFVFFKILKIITQTFKLRVNKRQKNLQAKSKGLEGGEN